MVSEIHCPHCNTSLKRVNRFWAARFLPLIMALISLAVRSLGLAGPTETSLLFSITIAVVILGIGAAIWDNTYPRFQITENSGSGGSLNPPDLVSKS